MNAFRGIFKNVAEVLSNLSQMLEIAGITIWQNDRSSYQRCSVKKVFLEISQNSQETLVPESLF